MKLLLGKKIRQKIVLRVKKESVALKNKGTIPQLAVILVGSNAVSKVYINEKQKACQMVGIKMKKYILSEDIGEEKVLKLINDLNKKLSITAILVQLPLPKGYNTDKVLNKVAPEKDVDGLGQKPLVTAPTARAIMAIFSEYKINLKNKKICLIGFGRLVGKPLAKIFRKEKLKFVVCTSQTQNLSQKTKSADIIISATGKADLIKPDMIKDKVILIDAGTSEEKSKISGDVDYEAVKNKASAITPPRGGIGSITVAKLLENIVKLTEMKIKKGAR